ncbi:putative mei5 protein [Phaeoacremonium minimum UCRPA7]|uniref:Putative mei5 protein n=1 Tax=Phaeoacremonium minimum (strain UCR-PA7) TaxID=1286976 RepID=R8BBU2_PHAM7|nr:putative mei5 protein [Phaeoacremonium minimum UCRPA7]EON96771.1 putative mei5 protein [Phaeoacremonium minimum UCRPA7]
MSTQVMSELSDPELKTCLNGFFKAVRKLNDDASYHFIADIVSQNVELTKENSRLESTEKANITQIVKLGRQLDDARTELRNKGDLEAKLQDSESRLAETDLELQKTIQNTKKYEAESRRQEAKASKLGEQLQEYKKIAEAQAREAADKLQKIDSWRVPMKVGKTETEKATANLHALFIETCVLVKNYFSDDLSDQICRNTAAWEALRKHDAVSRHKIPLPSSNSPQAKQVRIAAVLAVLGHHLAEQVFQPLYVREEGGELDDLLSDVASEDPPREAFLRSVLLAALSTEEQQDRSRERLKNVLQQVISAVQPLIADSKQDAFRRTLIDICGRYCKAWSEIQHLEDRVEWSLDDDEPENFELLERPRLEDIRLNRDNGGDQGSGGSKADSNRHPDNAVPRETRGNTDSIAAPVWPWFFVRRGEGQVIAKGFALGEMPVKVAKSEMSSLKRAHTGARREARQKSRQNSGQGEGSDKTSKSFLSPNGSAE